MINWIKRGYGRPPVGTGEEFLFWIEEYLGDGAWTGSVSVETFNGI